MYLYQKQTTWWSPVVLCVRQGAGRSGVSYQSSTLCGGRCLSPGLTRLLKVLQRGGGTHAHPGLKGQVKGQRDSPFPWGCWAARRQQLLLALTGWSCRQWMGLQGFCLSFSPHQGLLALWWGKLTELCWAPPCSGRFLAASASALGAAAKLFAFLGHGTCLSVPSVLPKAPPSAAPPWGALLPRGSVPTLLAWAPVRGDPVLSSGSPLLDANAQPVSSWGALPHQRGMDAGFQPQGPISNKKCTQVLR